MSRRRLVAASGALAAAVAFVPTATAALDDADRARQAATAAEADLKIAEQQISRSIALYRLPRTVDITVARARANLLEFMRLNTSVQRAIESELAGSNLAGAQRVALADSSGRRRAAATAARRALVLLRTPSYAASGRPTIAQLRSAFTDVRQARRDWFQGRGRLAVAVRPITLRGFSLGVPAAPFAVLQGRLPGTGATAQITDEGGVQRLNLVARGLPTGRRYTVFLTQNASPPFGAVQYLASMSSGADGTAKVRATGRLIDAFTIAGDGTRANLDNVVVWFSDPADDNGLFTAPNQVDPDGDGDPGTTTAFDADGRAGVAVLVSSPGALG